MRTRSRRIVWAVLAATTLLTVLAIGVFPTRQYLDQRQQTSELHSRLRFLRQENDTLRAQIEALGTTEEIERIARADYGYVRPDEETYVIVVPAGQVTRVPTAWPFG